MKERAWRLLDDGSDEVGVLERVARRRSLDPALEVLHDPFLMPDMAVAVERIQKAIQARERILIFGDYDADGITGSTLLYTCLKDMGAWVGIRLPHRERDGYGLQVKHAEEAASKGIQLLITVDNGTTATHALKAARKAGLDVIILDHHSLHGESPPCLALVNPHRPDSHYPERILAAVGIVFKLTQALGWKRAHEQLDMVALGTVADMAQLVGENRQLVKLGLEHMRRNPSPGIRAMLEQCKHSEPDAMTLGWQLGPRVNASGRLDDPMLASELLMAQDRNQARELADRLEKLNLKRRELQDFAMDEVRKALNGASKLPPLLIMRGANWHLGVIGLIAGRMQQEFERPAVVLSGAAPDGRLRGSARSLPGYHITQAFDRCREHIDEFGGHAEAAGLTVHPDNYHAFARALTRDAFEREDGMEPPALEIDTLVRPNELELDLLRQLKEIEPCGTGNPAVNLGMANATITRTFSMSGGKHLKLILEKGGREFEAVWWNHGSLPEGLEYRQAADCVFTPQSNTWNGKTNLQLVLEDLRPAGAFDKAS